VGHDPRAAAATQVRRVAGVIGMPVSEQDGAYVPDRGACLAQSLLDPRGPARQTRVDQHHAVVGHHQMSVDEQDPDLEDTLGDFLHHSTLAAYGCHASALTAA
jgi:hypothetical protein